MSAWLGAESAAGQTMSGQHPPGASQPVPPAAGPELGDQADGDAGNEPAVARRIRARGLVAGQGTAAVAAAIYGTCGPAFGTTWIRAYRLAAGSALADIVEQVKAWHEHDGRGAPRFSETLLSAYESGRKRPGPAYLHYLCRVYHADPEDLGFPARCVCARSHRDGSTASHPADVSAADGGESGAAARQDGGTAAPVAADGGARGHHGDTCAEHDDVIRRALFALIAGAAVPLDSGLAAAIDGVRRHLDRTLLNGGVTATALDQWEEAAAGYGRQYMTVPPLQLLCEVLLDLNEVRRMSETRLSMEAHERLCRLAAHLSALAGMTMIDVGDHRLARSFFRTARTAADEMGDRALRAWVAARTALVPLYYGDSREALRLARISQDLAGRTACAAGSLAAMTEARALAKAGPGHPAAAQDAARAFGRAHAVFARLSEDQRADTAFGHTWRQMLFHQGEALADLGAGEADGVLAEALGAYPASEHVDRSLVCFDQAMCHLLRGELEHALAIGEVTLDGLPHDHRPEIIAHRARELLRRAEARHGNHRRLASFRDRLEAMRPAAGLALRIGQDAHREADV